MSFPNIPPYSRCSRCHGADPNCPNCHQLEEAESRAQDVAAEIADREREDDECLLANEFDEAYED